MTSLDELERTILGDARAFIEPKAADEPRVFTQLVAHLGLVGAATVSHVGTVDRGIATRLRRAMGTRKAVALSFALLGAGAGYGAGFFAGRQSSHANVAKPTAGVETQAVASHVLPIAAPEQQAANARLGELVPFERRVMTPESTARLRSATSEADNGVTGPSVADPMGEELALLKRAERAIRSKNALLALGFLRELEQRYPKGKLLEERTAARVMANCQQLEPAAARRAGEAYLRQAASGVYHERVRQLCGLTEVEPSEKTEGSEKASVSPGD